LASSEVDTIVDSIARREAQRGDRRTGDAVPVAIPDAVAMARQQVDDALAEGVRDHSGAPRWSWPSLDALVGPVLPGELWVIGARPGGGKTTLLLNWIDALAKQRIGWVYAGMEMSASQLRRLWAGWTCGFDPSAVFENAWHRLPAGAKDAIDRHLQWQARPEVAPLAQFAPARRIGVAELAAWTTRAVDDGCRVVIVDHFHRMAFGDGNGDLLHAKGEAVRTAKELAVKHDISIVLAAQLNRGGRDVLEPYYPPPLTALKECGTLEEESDRVLMLHRALRRDLPRTALADVRDGRRTIQSVAEPNTLAICCRKHRRNGNQVDRDVRLAIHDNVITDGRFTVNLSPRAPYSAGANESDDEQERVTL
jgi:replicative DNA helicase